jgi:hypothetical protein
LHPLPRQQLSVAQSEFVAHQPQFADSLQVPLSGQQPLGGKQQSAALLHGPPFQLQQKLSGLLLFQGPLLELQEIIVGSQQSAALEQGRAEPVGMQPPLLVVVPELLELPCVVVVPVVLEPPCVVVPEPEVELELVEP